MERINFGSGEFEWEFPYVVADRIKSNVEANQAEFGVKFGWQLAILSF